jgi:hypothetical protein
LNGRRRPSPGQDARCPLGFGSHADRWPRDFSSGPAGQSLSMTATEGNHQPTLWSLVKDGWQSADAAVEGLVTALPIPDVQNAIVSLTWCQMIRAQRANLSSSGRRTRSEARTRIPTAQPTARTRLYRRAAPGGGNVPASDQQRKGTSLPGGLVLQITRFYYFYCVFFLSIRSIEIELSAATMHSCRALRTAYVSSTAIRDLEASCGVWTRG